MTISLCCFPNCSEGDSSTFKNVDWAVKRVSRDISRLLFCHSKGKFFQTMLYLEVTAVYWLPFVPNESAVGFGACHRHVFSQPWGCCLLLWILSLSLFAGELQNETPHSGALAPLFIVQSHNSIQASLRLYNHHKHPVTRPDRCIFAANASTWCQSEIFLPVNKRRARACIYFNKLATVF